ncbi:MAG: ABC transporter substrate-binding protein [Caldilineaceae bacterium]|nr:ABC transporter substrate-binding protein [Caldilineaceae bacterium]
MLVLGLLLQACAAPAPAPTGGESAAQPAAGEAAAPASAKSGGTLIYGRYADSLFLDPVLNDANLDIWVLNNLYDTLLQSTLDGQGIEPMLAESYSVSDDGLTFTVTLRPGTMFADGSPITPADVKWSLDRARNPENGIWSFTLESVASIETQGDNQVVLTLSRPDPSLPAALAMFNSAIMPQALFEAMPGETDEEKAKAFADKPVGSGPFVLTEWVRGEYMVIERNPYYWAKDADGVQLPYLDAVRFEIIPEDATRILKLQAGEINGAEFIPLSRVAELDADPNISMELFPSTKVNDILMNNRETLLDGSSNPLSDVRVRQALNHATDKQALIQVVTYGTGVPMGSYMSSTTPLFAQQDMYPYDVEKAKELLADAGYENGFEVTCLAIAGNADDAALLTALQQMWAEVGVTLTIEQVDAATRTDRYRNNDFQMRTAAWTNDINDPSQITTYFAIYDTVESLHTGFQSAELEDLFAQSQQELDQVKRGELYQRIQEIYVDAAPIVFLYETPYPVALRSNVKGFYQIPLGQNLFVGAYFEQ